MEDFKTSQNALLVSCEVTNNDLCRESLNWNPKKGQSVCPKIGNFNGCIELTLVLFGMFKIVQNYIHLQYSKMVSSLV